MYTDEIKEIENLINIYFKGIYYGDTSSLETCFSINAFVYGDIKSNIVTKSANEYLETVKLRKSPNDLGETLNMSIIGIDILGKIALAKLHVPMLGYNYYDYLSLVNIDNNWKIVNKIFTHVA